MAEEMWTYAMEEMSYPDVQEILKTTDVVLIPIGSQEKHGPHIPLATDSIVTRSPVGVAIGSVESCCV